MASFQLLCVGVGVHDRIRDTVRGSRIEDIPHLDSRTRDTRQQLHHTTSNESDRILGRIRASP